MALQRGLAQQPGADSAWNAILRPIGVELQAAARELSEAAVGRLRELEPTVFDDPTSSEQVRANAELSFRAIADSLTQALDPSAIEMPPGLLEGARARAQRGFPVGTLMRAFRVAHEVVWEWVMARIFELAADQAQQHEAAALGSSWMFVAIDRLASGYSEVYESERERWLRSAAGVRTETLAAILDGSERDVAHASSRLGYELDRQHIGLIAWFDESREGSGQPTLRTGIEQLASDLRADGTLLEPLGQLATMAWLSRAAPFEQSALDGLPSQLRSPGLASVALGEPSGGLSGVRSSHRQATHARRVAILLGRRPGSVTRFRDVELTALATADIDLAQAFVETTLGSLTGDDDSTRRIAATLSVYLREGCSRTRAAKRLELHENTIGYRVRQAEALLGRPVNSDQLRLTVALQLLPAVRDRL